MLEIFRIIMSLESVHDRSDQYPHVVTRFNSVPKVCNCNSGKMYAKSCGAISFDEVANVVLKGINVTVYTPSISGIVFWNVSSTSVQSTTVYSSSSHTCAYGILVVQAESLQVNSVGTYSFKIGLEMRGAGNVSITNITTRYNHLDGIQLIQTNNVQITNTTTTHNVRCGMYIIELNNILLKMTTAMFNGDNGIYLERINNVQNTNTITTHTGQ